jgi:hypothetical protein
MGICTFIFHGLNITNNEYVAMRKILTDICQKTLREETIVGPRYKWEKIKKKCLNTGEDVQCNKLK